MRFLRMLKRLVSLSLELGRQLLVGSSFLQQVLLSQIETFFHFRHFESHSGAVRLRMLVPSAQKLDNMARV
jgi:hypothetical protein